MLVDGFGRVAADLRLSLTDRCGLRCAYCMPAEGLPWLPHADVLSSAEIVRLATILVGAGIRRIRITGGEPLLRPDASAIVTALSRLRPRPELAMTTNGVALASAAPALAAAGLDRINVSLDTVHRERFAQLTRRDVHGRVLAGLAAAHVAGLRPVKVNAVLLRGVNDDEAVELLEFCLERGYELRFLEQMPLDPQHGWDRTRMITGAEILAALRTRWTLTETSDRGSAPAARWLIDGGPATVGVIASVTAPFCGDCDRLRLTADGQLRTCLFARTETDLRTPLRAGATDDELLALAVQAVAGKAAGHGINEPGFAQPARPMSAIGG